METTITQSPEEAASYLRSGEVVAFPTETVYGLGANVFDERAVAKIFTAKGRPADNPLIVHIYTLNQIEVVASSVPHSAARLIEHFFPGPLTVIIPKEKSIPPLATGNLPTVGIRMPSHPIALSFLQACETPVAAPSANVSGRPSPTTWKAVWADLSGRIPCILEGGRSQVGLESTVVDCTGIRPQLLRAGAIDVEQLQATVSDIVTSHVEAEALARSPGTRYRHYAPRALVQLVESPEDVLPSKHAAYIGLDKPDTQSHLKPVLVCSDVTQYAHELFEFFRTCDSKGVEVIYCQKVEHQGMGSALMDRLQRAARR